MPVENFLIFVLGISFTGITIIALTLQMRQQKRTTSADISLRMIERMREKDFRKVVDDILDNNIVVKNNIDLERLLNHFEYMAQFYYDELVMRDHIKLMYLPVLLEIKKNEEIKETFFPEKSDLFINLRYLLRDI